MTDRTEIDFVIRNFMDWTTEGRRDHTDLLERANDLFVEHGFAPFSGIIVDAVAELQGILASRAQDRMGLDPEDDVDDVSKAVAAWSRRTISEGSQDMMILAAIYAMGADELESALEGCVPEAPSY